MINYSKTSGGFWQYYRDEQYLNSVINNFPVNSASFKLKQTITVETGADGTKDVEIIVLLKFLINFWGTFEMPLINCEVNLILTWSPNCVISSPASANQAVTFTITGTKLYVPIITLSTQENAKLLQKFK